MKSSVQLLMLALRAEGQPDAARRGLRQEQDSGLSAAAESISPSCVRAGLSRQMTGEIEEGER